MRQRRFGRTDLSVSEVTFGAMRFAPGMKGRPDLAEGKRALEAALAGGLDTIHSSYEYETRYALSEVLAHHPKRHELHHVIKVTVPDYEDTGFDSAKFRGMIEEALRDLHAERIAVVQHLQRGVPKEVIYDERGDPGRLAAMPAVNAAMREAFEELRGEGKVGYLATFPHTPAFAAAAVDSGAFDGMVAFFNLVEAEFYPLFETMRAKGMGFFSMRPFREGMLTDKRARRETLPEGDPFRAAAFDEAYRRFTLVRRELRDEVRSWSAFAIKFALADPLFCSVIVSMNTVAQVEGVLAAADGDYPDRAVIARVHRLLAG